MSGVFLFEIEQIRSVTGAKWVQKPERPPFINGIAIDSRESIKNKAFIAIRGAAHDGHDHLQQAAEQGASLLLIESSRAQPKLNPLPWPPGVAVLHVPSTRVALGKIAHAHRLSLRGTKVIAVTGSSGKTTAKRLIHGVLSQAFAGTASPKSFNNDIGVPLTLLAGKSSDRYIVVEVGTNHRGEIADLAAIAKPDIAIITMIGRSHLEGLGSIEGVAIEKGSLLAALSKQEGVAIVNADYPLLRPHLRGIRTRFLFGESEDADLRLTDRGVDANGPWFEVNGRSRFSLSLPGKHNAINALAAVAVGRRFGLSDDDIHAGLLSVQPDAMRMTRQIVSDVTIYNDAYNANPDSMIAALNTFAELAIDAPRRVLILGDMLELGIDSASLHGEVADYIASIDRRLPWTHIMLVGQHMKHAADRLMTSIGKELVTYAVELDRKAMSRVKKIIAPGDWVLLKGSRGMHLERLIEALQAPSAGSGGTKRSIAQHA